MNFPVNKLFAIEVLITSLQRQIEDLLGKPFSFDQIQLSYPAPHYKDAYQNYCQCPIEFNAEHDAIWISLGDMNQALPLANPMSQKQSIAICQTEMARLDNIRKGDIQWRLRHEFQKHEHIPDSLDNIATHMAMSPRTLRRKLQISGTSYRLLLQEHQLQKSLEMLSMEHIALEDVARSCGFADTTSFRQAFKRWTDITPLNYRKQFQGA